MVDQAHARNAAAVSRLEPGNTTPVCDEDGSACSAYSPARPRADDPSGSGARGMEVGGAQRPCSASCLAIPLAKLRSPEVRKELWSTLIVFRDTTFSSTDTGSNKPYPPHVRDFAEARHRARRSGTQVELEPRAR